MLIVNGHSYTSCKHHAKFAAQCFESSVMAGCTVYLCMDLQWVISERSAGDTVFCDWPMYGFVSHDSTLLM